MEGPFAIAFSGEEISATRAAADLAGSAIEQVADEELLKLHEACIAEIAHRLSCSPSLAGKLSHDGVRHALAMRRAGS
jgi:hypothetical protein